MMADSLFAPAREVPLPAAPLELVVAQVRFPPIMSIARESGFIGPFQESLRKEYPILRPTTETQVVLTPEGVAQAQEGQRVWRFEQKGGPWQVALATDFIAVATNAYTNRADFLARLGTVLEAIDRHLEPGRYERVGARYVSRVVERPLLEDLPRFLRPEVLGVAGVSATPDAGVQLKHALTDTLFDISNEEHIRARWGLLPPQTTFDATLPPREGPSFVFDFDVYSDVAGDFSPIMLRDMAAHFSELQYSLFRWAVTDDFLRAYGGEV